MRNAGPDGKLAAPRIGRGSPIIPRAMSKKKRSVARGNAAKELERVAASASAPMRRSGKVRVEVTPGRLIGAIVALVALCGAVALGVAALGRAGGAPVALPEATPAGEILVRETFETLDAWLFKTSSGPNYAFSLQDGAMAAEVNGTALHNYYQGGDFDTASVEVEARWVGGDEDKNGRYGLVLRRQGKSAYYFEYFPFQDGLWSLQVGVNDTFDMLGRGNLPRDRQRPATDITRLRADLVDGRIRLFVNGGLVGEYDGTRIAKGQIGVSVTADAGRRSKAAFDNFVIRRP